MEKKDNREERMGKGRLFERIRRITGYLVGTLEKWNNAKKAEEADRVMHNLNIDFTCTEGFFDLLMGKDEEKDEK